MKNTQIEKQVENAEKIAQYITKSFQHEKFKSLFGVEYSRNNASYDNIGNIIMTYAIATRDFSEQGLNSLLDTMINFAKTQDEYGRFHGFEKQLSDLISSHVATKITVTQDDDAFSKMTKVLQYIEKNSLYNGFYTHTFNEALQNDIEKDGLDINKERFREQYEILGTLGKAPYTTGKLFIAKPSVFTFTFARSSPERFTLGVLPKESTCKRLSGEANREYFARAFQFKLDSNKDLTSSEYNKKHRTM